jgi:hypothetical protein
MESEINYMCELSWCECADEAEVDQIVPNSQTAHATVFGSNWNGLRTA